MDGNGVEQLLSVAADSNDKRLPEVARACVTALGAQLRMLKAQILQFDRMITVWHRSSEASRRLDDIPGVGPALATALVASIADPKAFRSGRNFSAWIGLVPKQNSSGGKDRLGSISKRGDRYLRSLFTTGALAVIRYAKIHGTKHRPWLTALLARRPTKVAAIALANKIARASSTNSAAYSRKSLDEASGASSGGRMLSRSTDIVASPPCRHRPATLRFSAEVFPCSRLPRIRQTDRHLKCSAPRARLLRSDCQNAIRGLREAP